MILGNEVKLVHFAQEFVEWNARYRAKFGFVFLICASRRGTPAILAELKVRFVLLFCAGCVPMYVLMLYLLFSL